MAAEVGFAQLPTLGQFVALRPNSGIRLRAPTGSHDAALWASARLCAGRANGFAAQPHAARVRREATRRGSCRD
jgi:hypothetical protein